MIKITNWYKHCENIFNTNQITRLPNDTDLTTYNPQYVNQERYYIRFLLSLGMKQEECYETWCKITNGMAFYLSDQEKLRKARFLLMFANALKLGRLEDDSQPVFIYQSEIDFLNSLIAPYWVRKFWFGKLIWFKHRNAKYKKVYYSVSWESWILSKVAPEFEMKRKSSQALEWEERALREKKLTSKSGEKLRLFSISNDKYGHTFIKYNFCERNTGKEPVLVLTLDKFSNELCEKYLVKENCKCSKCGSLFEIVDAHTFARKPLLCDSCYSKDIYLRFHKGLNQEKMNKIHKCSQCGEQYYLSHKSHRQAELCDICYRKYRYLLQNSYKS